MTKGKQIKGEKYIYLAMAFELLKLNKTLSITIGHDNEMKGGQNFYRIFTLHTYENTHILTETKTSAHFADFSRSFIIIPNTYIPSLPAIYEHIDNNKYNYSKNWTH